MKALILAGGRGMRFKPITDYVPKVMIPINNKPIIDYNVKMCRKMKVNQIYILGGYKAEVIADYYKKDKDVRVVKETRPLGTGGAIQPFLNNEDILVMNGDSLYKICLDDMEHMFLECKCKVLMAIAKTKDIETFGSVKVVKSKIKAFNEKVESGTGWASIGIYMFRKDFRIANREKPIMLETDIFPKIAQEGNLWAYKKCTWYPIDSPERYNKALNFFDKKCKP